MKGQFMMISAIVIGFILLSASSTISKAQSERFNSDETSYFLDMIKTEAGKVDTTSEKNRENFRKLIDSLEAYETDTEYWNRPSSPNCFNVTIRRPGDLLRLNCAG